MAARVERVETRAAGVPDVDAIHAIETASHPTPWPRERFVRELGLPQSRFSVAVLDGRLAGYLCAWEIAGEIEIHNVVAAPEMRRRGVAAALMKGLLVEARRNGVERVFLEVRQSNRAAIELYARFGFSETGKRRGYYADGEDALLMEHSLK